ncbi:glycoside hydrolase family 78 protein [Fusarium austroafricanum]|uniref:alpha-L-rhamnosidase n=1 Tax=Fusarium austroafricanum TaxID=2364996 RepID=A0A8H4KA78_9HYPO|nr:glycoside hydrolase family 78 protein [Fusarium austroafricanum]
MAIENIVVRVTDVRFEHHRPQYTLGLDNPRPRISWRISSRQPTSFYQSDYEIEVYRLLPTAQLSRNRGVTDSRILLIAARSQSSKTQLVPWPCEDDLKPRERVAVRVRAWSANHQVTAWSDEAVYELGLPTRDNWHCTRIASTRLARSTSSSQQEQVFRKAFKTRLDTPIARARLYVVVQGVYQAEINGCRVSHDFLAPGWTVYDDRIRYQTYDIEHLLVSSGQNCIGFRLADGWFCGRLGFFDGRRLRWGPYPTLMTQLEIIYSDGSSQSLCSDASWLSQPGPAIKAEIYDGEKYDANSKIHGWSDYLSEADPVFLSSGWEHVTVLEPLPDSVNITAGFAEPIRPVQTLQPVDLITTPRGKNVIDFGQNLVGYVRLKKIMGQKGSRVTLRHAEVLENNELGLRPLRICEAMDEYVCDGRIEASWEPSFTYHGFRYCQIDGLSESINVLDSIEAAVCHNDMELVGEFTCSDPRLNKLHDNSLWSMRGNFFSIPTDCPQRDERLGWAGDIAQFASTAVKLYDCAMASQNDAGIWSLISPVAIWHDVVILVPWALYEASGDAEVLKYNYNNMKKWIDSIPRDEERKQKLWNRTSFQLGDWLDPTAPPDQPMDGQTDPVFVADAFLIHSLDLMVSIATILNQQEDAQTYNQEATTCRQQFSDEYVCPNGRISSVSQTAYALAIVFDLLRTQEQMSYAGRRLATIVRRNKFRIGTGFAGTPFLYEALVRTGHASVAYAALLCEECPSWLYPLTVGATTMWERWDSMLPDGKVNPGEMTSFNHYCFGSVVSFLYERLGGLQCVEPGWKKFRFAPQPGGGVTSVHVKQLTPYGCVSAQWKIEAGSLKAELNVPNMTEAEVVLPFAAGDKVVILGGGHWSFIGQYCDLMIWPVEAIAAFPSLEPSNGPK